MDQSAEAVQAYAAENRLPTNRMEISFTQVLVNTGKELILFDTGNAEARRPTAGNAVAALAAAGYEPSQIDVVVIRSEEHTSELQSLMRISYAVFCLKKKTT